MQGNPWGFFGRFGTGNQPRFHLGDLLNFFMPFGTSGRELFNSQQAQAAPLPAQPLAGPSPVPMAPRVQSPIKQGRTDFFGHFLPTNPNRVIRYAPGQNTGVGLNPTIVSRPSGPFPTRY